MSQLLDPNWNRATFLPYARHKQTGEGSWAVPGVLADLLSAVMLPGDVYQGNVLLNDPETGRTSDQVIRRSADLAGALTLGAGAVPAQGNSLRMGIKAYHGSPHDFDRFSMDKIGTGEGAQAYGHGLYFAENEGVAKSYKDTLSKSHRFENKYYIDGKLVSKNELTKAQQLAMMAADDPAKADQIRQVKPSNYWSQSDIDEAVELAKAGRVSYSPPGRMYEVDINANPDDFLDWDKPLSEQSSKVQAAVANVANLRGESGGYIWDSLVKQKNAEGAFGEHIADPSPAIKTGPKAAMQSMREAGVPGIKYLDAGSRGAGDGSRNYVVFDDKLISIVRKYGLAGAVAAGVITQQQAQQMQEQGLI